MLHSKLKELTFMKSSNLHLNRKGGNAPTGVTVGVSLMTNNSAVVI